MIVWCVLIWYDCVVICELLVIELYVLSGYDNVVSCVNDMICDIEV